MKLFSWLGTEVRLHWSIVIPLGITAFHPQHFAIMVVAFATVVAHEFGHILAGRRFGVKCPQVILSAIGGAALMDGEPETPWGEFVTTVCGPLVNVVFAILALPFIRYDFGVIWLTVNLFLLIFNAIPAYPMDGGRVLRSILWALFGKRTATRICIPLSVVLAIIGLVFAVIYTLPMLAVVSVFVAFLALMEMS